MALQQMPQQQYITTGFMQDDRQRRVLTASALLANGSANQSRSIQGTDSEIHDSDKITGPSPYPLAHPCVFSSQW